MEGPDQPEMLEDGGRKLEVVPKVRVKNILTGKQAEVKMELYRRLAAMLPVEGKDYVFEVNFMGQDPRPSLRFVPKTPVGTMWCNYIAGEFRKMTK